MGAFGLQAQAWTEFWREQKGVGCCASAVEILRPIHEQWRSFAASLPAGGEVIDLGCGSGAAARALVAGNSSLHVIGVDFAAVPAMRDPRIEIRANTRMECLPWAEPRFDAAVSQFGFEYASVEDASRELARVLRAGARICLLVHHAQGRIATDSVLHRMALAAICGASVETAFLAGDARGLDRALAIIRHQFPRERIIDEAAAGLLGHLGQPPAHRARIWQAINAALAPEISMLADLEASAVSPEGIGNWLRPLAARFELDPPAVLAMDGGGPLCWRIAGVRRAD